MNKLMISAAGLMLFGASSMASAEVGVGVKVSTLGAGIEVGVPLSDRFVVRGALNQYSRDDSQSIDGIDYDADLDLKSTALFFDWHPMKGPFHLTAGYLFTNSELNGTATPTGTFDVGGTTYDGSMIDVTLHAGVDLGSGPYLGLGWGNLPAKGLGFTFEVGAVQQGSPDVSLTASGADSGAISQSDLDQEERNMQDDLDKFKLYPVVSLGLSYGF
ncbi:MAG TPA: hypothetical protein VGB35_10960 [Gammaproteobacteria bacterium]|jgi:hypothetical protein